MDGLAILFVAAAVGFGLAQRFRLPVIPLLILIGFAAGKFAGGHGGGGGDGPADTAAFSQMLEVGLAFLVFSAGLSLNPRTFTGRRRAVLWVGFTQFAAASLAGFLAGIALGFDNVGALYLGATLSTSSTLVVVHELYRRPGRTATYARLVTGVLLVQDAVIITLIVLLEGATDGMPGLAKGAVAMAGLGVAATLLQRWLPQLMLRAGHRLDEERLLLAVLAFLFAFAGVAAVAGIPFVAGAFAAGFALSGFPISGVVRGVLGSLNTFFLAVFFTALGAVVDVPSPGEFLAALALVATLLLVTPPLVTLFAEWKGKISSRGAITAGILVAQASEFAVVLALFGRDHGHISDETLSVIALVAVVSMTLTPFLATPRVAEWLLGFHPLRRRMAAGPDLRDHAVMLGYGTSGEWVLKPIRDAGLPVVVIDQDPAVVDQLNQQGVTALRGDAGDEKVLAQAGVANARFVLATLPDVTDTLKVIQSAFGVPVVARVFEEWEGRAVERAGGVPIVSSLAAAERFMEWFETFLESELEIESVGEDAEA